MDATQCKDGASQTTWGQSRSWTPGDHRRRHHNDHNGHHHNDHHHHNNDHHHHNNNHHHDHNDHHDHHIWFKVHLGTKVAKVSHFRLMEKFTTIMKMVNCAFRAVWQSCNVFLVFAMFSEHCSTPVHHNVLSAMSFYYLECSVKIVQLFFLVLTVKTVSWQPLHLHIKDSCLTL